MQKIFKDVMLQKTLEKRGFVKFKLPSTDFLSHIKKLIPDNLNTVSLKGHFHSLDYLETEQILNQSELIFNQLRPLLTDVLTEYQKFLAFLSIKAIGIKSSFPIHQDWCFVDENLYNSYNVFIPMSNQVKNSGRLYFLPGSHRYARSFRAAPLYPFCLENMKDELWEIMTPVDVLVGEAILFYHSTIHASEPNLSNQIRTSVLVGILDKDAQAYHFYMQNAKTENEYIVNRYNITPHEYISIRETWLPNRPPDYQFNYRFESIYRDLVLNELAK
jgi:hypothetical protein